MIQRHFDLEIVQFKASSSVTTQIITASQATLTALQNIVAPRSFPSTLSMELANGKLSSVSVLVAVWTLTIFSSKVAGYDGPSLSRWVASTSWRMMGTEIINSVTTQCGQGGISIYEAKWQTDCNLVVYKDFNPLWSSNTQQFGYKHCYLAMQRDGNLVIYGEQDNERVAIWSSNSTQPYQDDFYVSLTLYGNLGIFTSNNNPVWYSEDSNVPQP